MNIAIPLFEGLTALDAVGPYEVLSRVPGTTVTFVATTPGVKRTDNGVLGLYADRSLRDAGEPEIVVVPGGFGTSAAERDEELLDWLRTAHAKTTWTTSVCTGSLLLGAAGLLNGVRATTHWNAFERLGAYGAQTVSERVVVDGKFITSAGVSAGIDMALELAAMIAGHEIAQAIQLSIEYDPHPPFTTGSLATAPHAIVDLARRAAGSRRG